MKNALTNRIAVVSWVSNEMLTGNPFFGPIFTGIQKQLTAAGQTIVLRTNADDKTMACNQPFLELSGSVDGFLMLDARPQHYRAIHSLLRNFPHPVVLLNYEMVADTIDSVVFDSYKNTRRMMQFLIDLGHTRIGYVRAPMRLLAQHESDSVINLRTRAFQDALTENRLPLQELAIINDQLFSDPYYMRQFFTGPNSPTAFLCSDDGIAVQLYQVAASCNKKVPADVTIVGYDGSPIAASPPLTTMVTPLAEMGRYGAKRLLEKIEEKQQGIETHYKIVLPGKIFEGGSHRRIV